MIKHQDPHSQDSRNQKITVILGTLLIILAFAAAYFLYISTNTPETASNKDNKTSIVKSTDKVIKQKKAKKKKRKVKKEVEKSEKVAVSNEVGGASVTNADLDDKKPAEKDKAESDNISLEITDKKSIDDKGDSQDLIVEDLSIIKTQKRKASTEIDPLNEMPERKTIKTCPFTVSDKNIVRVSEKDFIKLKKEASKGAGKINPFARTNSANSSGEDIPKDLASALSDMFKKIMPPNPTKKVTTMPEAPKVPTKMVLPSDLDRFTDRMPPPPSIKTSSTIPAIKSAGDTLVTNSSNTYDLIASTYLTGVVGDAALLNINGQSRALHVGQNYQGVVVLSVSPRSVLIKVNGVQVTKQLRD